MKDSYHNKVSVDASARDTQACPASIVVLASGRGSNLQAIMNACANDLINAKIVAVASNRPSSCALKLAEQAHIPTEALDHTVFTSRLAFDQELAAAIEKYSPDVVVLAGFMRILSPEFVKKFKGKLLNIHPSLLPKYTGLHTHQRAIEAGDSIAGATVHFVTTELDGGPPILQAQVPVLQGDDANTLAQRVLLQEHKVYPLAIKWLVEGRLQFAAGIATLDGKTLPSTGYLYQKTDNPLMIQ